MDTPSQLIPPDKEDFTKIVQELNFEDIKNQDDFIKYVIRIYWDQWKYRIYNPRWVYIFWWIYLILLIWLIYIGMNGGATSDWAIRRKFFSFWVNWSNIIYFYIIIALTPWVIYPFLRTCRFNISYSTLCILYHIIPFLWVWYSIFHYFKKWSFFQKKWFFSVLRLYFAFFIIPFTFYIWIGISSIIF